MYIHMKHFTLLNSIFFFFFIFSYNLIACDTTPSLNPSSVIDNGDGTYYMDISVCIGSGGSADGFDLYFNNDIDILATTVTEVISPSGNVANVSVNNGVWLANFEDFNTAGTYFEAGAFGTDCIDFGIIVNNDPAGATICSVGINEDCLGFTQQDVWITCGAIQGPCLPNYSITDSGTIIGSTIVSGQNCNFAPLNDEIIELNVTCGGTFNFTLTQDESGGWQSCDTDGDGILNNNDDDIDGDGIPNPADPDIDGDGIFNWEDETPDGCSLSFEESWLTIATGCCSGVIEQTSSFFEESLTINTYLETGTYYVIVDVYSADFQMGNYTLDITSDNICTGCIYPSACNYNPEALFDDGSCEWFSCYGCSDPEACNYGGEETTIDDGSCEYVDGICELCINSTVVNNDSDNDDVCNPDDMCEGFDDSIDSDGDLIPDACDECPNDPYNDIDNDGLCYDEEIFGCTYLKACNYDPDATEDDGSCLFDFIDPCSGCLDPMACNFTPNASEDDGSCEYESCIGCTDYNACNFEADNTMDDGSCFYPNICNSCEADLSCIGCTDPLACNYDSEATVSSNMCEYPEFGYDCDGNPTGVDPDLTFCEGEEVEIELSVSDFNSENEDFTDSGVATDDIYSNIIDVGFDFMFYGNTYTQAILSSNNYLSFNLANANNYSAWPIDFAIPASDIAGGYGPLNSILAPWHDTNPAIDGQIAYTVLGEAPNRVFVASFCGIPMFSCTNWNSGSQIKLYESTNIIETHIMQKPLCSTWNEGAAIHGLQNIDGTIAEIVTGTDGIARNYPNQWEANQEAWRFMPSGDNNYTIEYIDFSPTVASADITWQDQYGNIISFGDTIVTVTENSSFNAIGSYCDSVDFVIENIDILFEVCDGCTDESACNYNPNSNEDDDSCMYPGDECGAEIIITNPSFEIDSLSGGGCFSAPNPWIDCMTYTSSNGTVQTTTPDTQPGCYFVETEPSEGDNYIGIGHILNYDIINPTMEMDQWQEGISQQLTSPMIANTAYTFTIDLANALTADPWNESGTTTTIGEIRVFGGFDSCSEEELLWSSGLIENTQWETYTAEFIPNSNYTHILFQAFNTGLEQNTSYTLMDNLSNISSISTGLFMDENCECVPYIEGCMDETACNYNENAVEEDNSCLYPGEFCLIQDGNPTYAEAGILNDLCECVPFVYGCIDEEACNYDPDANIDDQMCIYNPIDSSLINSESCTNNCDASINIELNPALWCFYCMWYNDSGEIISYDCDLVDACAGTYTLVVADDCMLSGCTEEYVYEVPSSDEDFEVDYIVSSYNGFGVSCNGASDGWIEVLPYGGTPPYTVSPVVLNDLSPGWYSVEVMDANGCVEGYDIYISDSEYDCLSVESHKASSTRELLQVVDVIGREVSLDKKGNLLLFIYDDGSIERKYHIK